MTCTQMVVEQAIAAKAILYGDQQHFLWDPRSSRTDYEETLSSVATVIKLIIDRLEAEFPKQALENCFSIFDVAAARKARDTDRWVLFETNVRIRCRRLLREGLRLNDDGRLEKAIKEFLSSLVRLTAVRTEDRELDNQTPWAQERLAGDGGLEWTELLFFYLAQEDSSCQVERDHAHGKKVLQAHSGPMDEQGVTYGDLLTLKLELPKTPDEIARPVDPGPNHGPNHGPNEGPKQFELTPLSRQFLQEWRLQHGCRFRVYEKRMGCRPKQEPKPGTDASVRAWQSRALRRRGDSATNPAGPTVLPGLDRSQVAAATSPSSGPNLENSRGLLNFAQRTALIKRNNQAIIDNRRQNAKAFPQAQLQKAIVISRRGDDANFNSNMARYLAGIRRWKVVDACQDRIETEFATPSEASPELRSRRLDGGDFLTFTAQSHLVVVDSLDALGSKRPVSGFNACHGCTQSCCPAET